MKKRILSGMRPTGKLHLGHYMGVLQNYVKLQDAYDCYFMVADMHALTTKWNESGSIRDFRRDMVLDWLGAGLDPQRSAIFCQSDVPEHAYLFTLLDMITPVSWAERNPTVKEMIRDMGLKDNVNLGLLSYPVLMAADIMVYRAEAVPVGKDQVPHLEFTRELVRTFNFTYHTDLFPEPQPVLNEFQMLPGLDGRKMSKSLDNAIIVSDPPEVTSKRMMTAYTDPLKIRKDDPGHPEAGCVIYQYHKLFEPSTAPEAKTQCEQGCLGCVAHKRSVAAMISARLEEFQKRRASFAEDPGAVDRILAEGREKASVVAADTVRRVREVMGI
jgi:tryptophanyl-tRNA synthetase